jgi:hypothetical protein
LAGLGCEYGDVTMKIAEAYSFFNLWRSVCTEQLVVHIYISGGKVEHGARVWDLEHRSLPHSKNTTTYHHTHQLLQILTSSRSFTYSNYRNSKIVLTPNSNSARAIPSTLSSRRLSRRPTQLIPPTHPRPQARISLATHSIRPS